MRRASMLGVPPILALCLLASCVWQDGPHARVDVLTGLAESSIETDLGYTIELDVAWLTVADVELYAVAAETDAGDSHGHEHAAEEASAEEGAAAVAWIPGISAINLLTDPPYVGSAAVPEGELAAVSLHVTTEGAPEELEGAAGLLHGLVTYPAGQPIELWIWIDEGGEIAQVPVHLPTHNDEQEELHLELHLDGVFDGVHFVDLADGQGRVIAGPNGHAEVAEAVHRALLDPHSWLQEGHAHDHDE